MSIEWRGFLYYALLLPALARFQKISPLHRWAIRFKQRQIGDLPLPEVFADMLPADTPEFRERYALFEVLRDADAFFDGTSQIEKFSKNFSIHGIEHLASLRVASTPVMFLSGHLGSFYAQYAVLGDSGYPLHVIARAVGADPASSLAKNWAERRNYARHGARIGGDYLYVSSTGRCGRDLVRALNAHEWMIAYLDVPCQESSASRRLPLLGQTAQLPVGAVERGVTRGYVFVTVWSHYAIGKDGTIQRIVEVEPPMTPNLSVDEVLAEYGQRLTAVVRRYPDQWLGRRILPGLFVI